MKYIKIFAMICLSLLSFFGIAQDKKSNQNPTTSIYSIKINTLMGEPLDLNQFKGKKMLFVNVASECGFTSQYEELQKLHEAHGDQLTIIGVPCNQFGGQEPGSADEIASFCKKNYGVEFIITEKIEVKGEGKHPLYEWLTEKEKNGNKSSTVKWNFQKYLVDENGNLIDFFYSVTKPQSSKIIKLL